MNDDRETYPKSICNLNRKTVENVEVFRYLGDDIRYDQPSTGDSEIDLRISLAEAKFNQLWKKLTNRKILLSTRIYILNTMVRSRLTYSCQTWNITQHQKERIDATYNNMLRKMIREAASI